MFDAPNPGGRRQGMRGFSLIELVVVIVLIGALAAIAVPRFFSLGHDARVAATNTLAAVARSTAEKIRVLCKLDPSCDYDSPYQAITVGGKPVGVCFGWLDAGGSTSIQVAQWVEHIGFSVVNAWPDTTFTLDGAPFPANCSVKYTNANLRGPTLGILIAVDTTGC